MKKHLSAIILGAALVSGCATTGDRPAVDFERAIPLFREAASSALIVAMRDNPKIRIYAAAAAPAVCSLVHQGDYDPEAVREALTALDVDETEYLIAANLLVGLYEVLYADILRAQVDQEPLLKESLLALCGALQVAHRQTETYYPEPEEAPAESGRY